LTFFIFSHKSKKAKKQKMKTFLQNLKDTIINTLQNIQNVRDPLWMDFFLYNNSLSKVGFFTELLTKYKTDIFKIEEKSANEIRDLPQQQWTKEMMKKFQLINLKKESEIKKVCMKLKNDIIRKILNLYEDEETHIYYQEERLKLTSINQLVQFLILLLDVFDDSNSITFVCANNRGSRVLPPLTLELFN
jgi:hypothetical protein